MVAIIMFLAGVITNHFWERYRRNKKNGFEYQNQLFISTHESNKVNDYCMDKFFKHRDYRKVLVYGLGSYYYQFMSDFQDASKFDFILADGDATGMKSSFKQKIYVKQDIAKLKIDCIVITSVSHAKEIESELKEIGIIIPIISYKELVMNLAKENY